MKGRNQLITRLKDVEIKSDLDRLVLLIKHLGIKQYEFARELGYSAVYVESVINGRSPLTAAFHKRVDSYLNRIETERQTFAEKVSSFFDEDYPNDK